MPTALVRQVSRRPVCGSTRRVDWALESGQRTAQAGTPEDEDVQGPPSRQAPRGTAHLIDADLVRLLDTLHALLWINDPQALDNLETTDRKSTRLNSSHLGISYAVFCLK